MMKCLIIKNKEICESFANVRWFSPTYQINKLDSSKDGSPWLKQPNNRKPLNFRIKRFKHTRVRMQSPSIDTSNNGKINIFNHFKYLVKI